MYLALAVEPKNLVTDAWRTSGLNLVQMAKQIESCSATAVVQLSLRQNSEDRTLTGVHVAQHRETKINKLQRTEQGNYRQVLPTGESPWAYALLAACPVAHYGQTWRHSQNQK